MIKMRMIQMTRISERLHLHQVRKRHLQKRFLRKKLILRR
ncbi:hypothetical protein U0070_013952 [Myodes glareolus]|uniref:Uncharacterized protein n=1 Tax=Myodes glareolus TaxID=447135 RepID=A0AAW0I1W1_MYOGA